MRSEKPITLNFFKTMSLLFVSNAFSKSIKIIPDSNPSPKRFEILSFKKERHVSVERFFLNPD